MIKTLTVFRRAFTTQQTLNSPLTEGAFPLHEPLSSCERCDRKEDDGVLVVAFLRILALRALKRPCRGLKIPATYNSIHPRDC
jgi:hypothetical protein